MKKESRPFLKPRLVGRRFEDHAIPLDLLKDLASLEPMIIEVAKWKYLQKHPERKRSPKGFTKGISFELVAIEKGSACPAIQISYEYNGLLPIRDISYFEKARDAIVDSIRAAEQDEDVTKHLPDHLLSFFDSFGRSLHEGEAIEFPSKADEKPVRLDRKTRKKLLSASKISILTEEVVLWGAIPEADQEKMTFDIQLINGPRIRAPISPQYFEEIMKAFNGYKEGMKVKIRGVGRYNRFGKLESMEYIEEITILEPNDIEARIQELKSLQDGWLDGKGKAPNKDELEWFCDVFENQYPEKLPLPFIYPTPEGGLQLEWTLQDKEISLEIDLYTHEAEWHLLDLSSGEDEFQELDMNADKSWEWLVHRLTETGSERENKE